MLQLLFKMMMFENGNVKLESSSNEEEIEAEVKDSGFDCSNLEGKEEIEVNNEKMMFEHGNGKLDSSSKEEEIKAEVKDSGADCSNLEGKEEIEVNDDVNNWKMSGIWDSHINPIKDVWKCELCNYVAKHRGTLTNHVHSAHSDINFPCDQCDFVGSCKRYITQHIRKHHTTHQSDHIMDSPVKPIKDVLTCEFCDFVAKKLNKSGIDTLRSHVSSVHSNMNFPCDQCEFKGSCKRYLKQHIRINHSTYQCDLCVFVAKNPTAMKVHLASEHNIIQESHLCDQCSFVALTAEALAKHVEDHNPFGFSCHLCDHKTKNNRNLKKHIKYKHTDMNKFLCDECDFTTSTNYNLVRHREKVHQCLSGDQKHECNQCSYVGKSSRALKNHISAHHLGIRYPCPYCEHQARRKGDLQVHVKRVHNMGPLENSYFEPHEILKKTLEIENKKVSYVEMIQNAEMTQDQKPYFHKQGEPGKKPGKPRFLKENSTLQNSYPHFEENVASEFPRKTEEDPDVLNASNIQEKDDSFSSLLEQEMKVEHSDNDDDNDDIWENPETSAVKKETRRKAKTAKTGAFKCDICQKVLSRQDKLTTHKLLHTGDKPFTCEVCGNKFLISGSLKQHMKTHQEGFVRSKLHQCSLCGKSYESIKRLTEHQFSHTGEKAYQCAECGVKYAVIESLNKHMKKHTDEKTFPFARNSRKGVSNVTSRDEIPQYHPYW